MNLFIVIIIRDFIVRIIREDNAKLFFVRIIRNCILRFNTKLLIVMIIRDFIMRIGLIRNC
jgi:hypothetical protein